MFRHFPKHRSRRRLTVAGLGIASLLLAAGCSSSGTKSATSATSATSSSPSTTFSAATASGLGSVVVDGRGHTVYVLTADGHTNLACQDSSGCTKVWPDLPLPDGVTSAKAGRGVDASKLGAMKLADGETYPTYSGWLMYEFTGDRGPAQAGGEGLRSFGGTWFALTSSGTLVQPAAASSTQSTSVYGGY